MAIAVFLDDFRGRLEVLDAIRKDGGVIGVEDDGNQDAHQLATMWVLCFEEVPQVVHMRDGGVWGFNSTFPDA